MNREQLDRWCEWAVVGLVLAILLYSPLATGAVRPGDFLLLQWLAVALLAAWSGRFVLNPKHRLLWPWICWPMLGFMLYAVARYLAADIEYAARQELLQVLLCGVIFFAVINNLHRQEFTRVAAIALLSVGTLIAMYAVGQYLTSSDRVWGYVRPPVYEGRGSGTFINPNNLAGYLEMLLPLALAYTITGRLKELGKVLVGYAAVVMFAGLVVTFSRWGWLAAGITLGLWLILVARQYQYRLPALGVVLAFVLVIFLLGGVLRPVKSKIQADRLAYAAQVEDVRFKFWAPALQMWKDYFWFGLGPGAFDTRFREYRPADPQLQVRPERVHNDYLNALVDWGLVGGLLLAGVWGCFYAEVVRSWRFVRRAPNDLKARRSNKASFVLGGSLGLLALLVHSWFDLNLHIPANAILAATLLALVSGHFRFATERHWHTARWTLRVPVLLALAATCVYLGAQAWRGTAHTYWLNRARQHPAGSAEQLAALEYAFAAEPGDFETAYQIGEAYRWRSWEGGPNYRALAATALDWFQRATELNPYYAYAFMRYGMCLHWLGRHDEAAGSFQRALQLDPNGYYTVAHQGWHFVQLGDWQQARQCFLRSLALKPTDNPIASSYLEIADRRLAEAQPAAPKRQEKK